MGVSEPTCQSKIETFLADRLREGFESALGDLGDLVVVSGRGNAALKPPYVACVLGDLEPIDAGVYRAPDAKVVVCSDIHDTQSDAHDGRLSILSDVLEDLMQEMPVEAGTARIHGLWITTLSQAPSEQTFSDVVHLTLGVSG